MEMKATKLKLIAKNPRVIIVMLAILVSIYFISPQLDTHGVAIRSVEKGSAAEMAGIQNPPSGALAGRERILEVNGVQIRDIAGYADVVGQIKANDTVTILTSASGRRYRLQAEPLYNITAIPANQLNLTISSPGNIQSAVINVSGTNTPP